VAAEAGPLYNPWLVWREVCVDTRDPVRTIAQARLVIVHAMHEAVRSVDLVFRAAGTNAI
jgi:hypothetical protein